jgi:hypothetical protein
MRKNTGSKYRGVSLYRPTHRWVAQLQVARERHYLGYFSTEEEAARARDAKVIELGIDAPLNFPPGEEAA